MKENILIGGGEMGDLIRRHKWLNTSLGPIEEWPLELRTTLNTMLNSKSPMFLFWGPELICFYNDAYRPSLGNQGKHPNALGGKAPEVWAEIWKELEPQTNKVMQDGQATWNEDVLLSIYRNGKIEDAYWTFSYSPVFDITGKPNGIFVAVMETTDKVNTLKKIEESEKNLRNVILQAPVAMCILKGDDLVVEIANDKMFLLWGKQREELMNKPIFIGLPEAKNQGFEELIYEVYHTGKTVSAFGVPATLPRNGNMETMYINFVYEAFREPDGKITGVMAVAAEVTEQVLASKKIEKSEASFRLLADSMPQFVWTSDANGSLEYYNEAVYNYSGLSFEQLQKDGWVQMVHPDDREENLKAWMHAIETGEDYVFRHRFKNKLGEYQWQLSRAIPQRDEGGHIQLWVGTSTDIHEQKLFEEQLQTRVNERTTELQHANDALQKINVELGRSNANLEEFAHAASHDLKEPIRKLHFYADKLKNILADRLNEEEIGLFTRMEKASERMNLLVEDLLTYSHVSMKPIEMEPIDLNEKINRVLEDLELLISQKQAKIDIEPLPTVNGYRRQLQQLFQNLIGNALKYSKTNVPPHITISAIKIHGAQLENAGLQEKEKEYYMIKVMDNGIGFEQANADKIFQMFQRLHGNAEYKGTGVGLSIARKVTENHKGYIEAQSEVNKGSTFNVYLPA